ETIDEDKKEVANEEMVITSELSDNESMDEEEATNLITLIKTKVSEENPQTKEDIRIIIEEIVEEKNYDLSKEEIEKLVDLFQKFKDLNIDWDVVNQKVNDAKGKVTDFLESDEGQNFIEKIKDYFKSLWNHIISVDDLSEISIIEKEKNYKIKKEKIKKLVDLIQKFKDLNIDWDVVNQKVNDAKGKVTDFLESDEGQNFIEKIKDFFKSLWNLIFGGDDSEA